MLPVGRGRSGTKCKRSSPHVDTIVSSIRQQLGAHGPFSLHSSAGTPQRPTIAGAIVGSPVQPGPTGTRFKSAKEHGSRNEMNCALNIRSLPKRWWFELCVTKRPKPSRAFFRWQPQPQSENAVLV